MRGLPSLRHRRRATGQDETEGAATAGIVFHPDSSAMPVDDALGHEQTGSDDGEAVLVNLPEPRRMRPFRC